MAGLSWFKFWVNAHESVKIAALDSDEFRLVTYLWALAQRSKEAGKIFLAPGVGVPPDQLAFRAGCRTGPSVKSPAEMLATLVRFQLIEMDAGGVITIHDWVEWNGRPDSKQPEARREQSRKDRDRRKVAGTKTEAKRKTEVEVEVEVEVEKELKKEEEVKEEERKAPRLASWEETEKQLPAIVVAFRDRLCQALAVTRAPKVAKSDPDDPGKILRVAAQLATAIERVGLDAALAVSVKAAYAVKKRESHWPQSLFYYLHVIEQSESPTKELDEYDLAEIERRKAWEQINAG